MDIINILFLLAFGFIVFVFFIKPSNKQKEQRKLFLEKLEKGDEVIMVSGLHGYFNCFKDEYIIIDSDIRGHKLSFLKEALSISETEKIYNKKRREKA